MDGITMETVVLVSVSLVLLGAHCISSMHVQSISLQH
jgi:hypothetical protein